MALHCIATQWSLSRDFAPGWTWRRSVRPNHGTLPAHYKPIIDVYYKGPGSLDHLRSLKQPKELLGSEVDFSSFDLIPRMRVWDHSPMATNSYVALEVLFEEERKLQFDSYMWHCIALQHNGDCRGISPRLVLKEFCAAHPWCPPSAY